MLFRESVLSFHNRSFQSCGPNTPGCSTWNFLDSAVYVPCGPKGSEAQRMGSAVPHSKPFVRLRYTLKVEHHCGHFL